MNESAIKKLSRDHKKRKTGQNAEEPEKGGRKFLFERIRQHGSSFQYSGTREGGGGGGKSGSTFKQQTVRTVEDVTVNEVEPKMKASLNYDNNNHHRERKY